MLTCISQLFELLDNGDKDMEMTYMVSGQELDKLATFIPRKHRNLRLIEEKENYGTISQIKVDDPPNPANPKNPKNPQIYALCAAGNRSTLRILSPGIQAQFLGDSNIPDTPNGIWTIRASKYDQVDKFIIIALSTSTLVLAITESIATTNETLFECARATIHIGLLEDDTMLQVTSMSFRQITKDKKAIDWTIDRKINRAASNSSQLVLSLNDGNVFYFETGEGIGLNTKNVRKLHFEEEIHCIEIGDIPHGQKRSKYLVVGLGDESVRIISIEHDTLVEKCRVPGVKGTAQSLAIIAMKVEGSDIPSMFLFIGLSNGDLMRAKIDPVTGEVSEIRSRYECMEAMPFLQ
jgi:splicing factor 3B subunit 3